MPKLRIEAGRGQGKTVEFEKQAIVGRGETTTLQIGDVKASREHCKVFEQGGTWVVADLNSRNGIKVNGVVTTRKNLAHGDRIEVGETVLVFETGGAATAAAAPAAGAAAAAAPAPAKSPAPAKASPPPPSPSRAAPAPVARSSAAPKSDAAAKKAAAMAEARAAAAKGAAAKPAGGAATKAATKEPGKGIEVSDRVLQFHKIDPKKATLLDVDMGQSTFLVKLGIWLACLAFLAILVWAVSVMV